MRHRSVFHVERTWWDWLREHVATLDPDEAHMLLADPRDFPEVMDDDEAGP